MASSFIKGLTEKLSILAGDWLIMQPDAEEDTAYKIKKSNVKSDATEPSTWYLNSDEGDDGNVGSPEFPFKNPQAAHDASSQGDILFFQNREYFSNQDVTITKSLTLKGSIPANDNDIAAPFISGDWDIASGKSLMIINLWVRSDFTHPSASWFLQMTGCHFDGTLPNRKTKLILNDCLWELGGGQDLFSLEMYGTTAIFGSTIDISSSFTIERGSTFQGSIIAGLDSSTTCELKDSSIKGAVTITGNLNKLNAVVVGTETVSGTTTNRQAKVFDDNTVFEKQVRGGSSTVAFSATKTFSMDNGNFQKMPVTAAITSLAISDDLNGHAYWIMLEIGGAGSYTIPQAGASFGTRTDNSVDDSVASWFPTTVGSKIMYTIARDPDGEKIYSIETITV